MLLCMNMLSLLIIIIIIIIIILVWVIFIFYNSINCFVKWISTWKVRTDMSFTKYITCKVCLKESNRRVEHASIYKQLQQSKLNTCLGAASVFVGRGTGKRVLLKGSTFQTKSVAFIAGGSDISADVHKQSKLAKCLIGQNPSSACLQIHKSS